MFRVLCSEFSVQSFSIHPLLRTLALAGALGTSANLGHATIAVSNITADFSWLWSVESLSSFERFTVGNQAVTLQGLNFQMSWIAGGTAHVDRRIVRLHAAPPSVRTGDLAALAATRL